MNLDNKPPLPDTYQATLTLISKLNEALLVAQQLNDAKKAEDRQKEKASKIDVSR